jgi:hypothetical protein
LGRGEVGHREGCGSHRSRNQESEGAMPREVAKISVQVEIEYDDGEVSHMELGAEHGAVVQEFGFDRVEQPGCMAISKEPNGQHRTCIKLWSGMESYEDLKQ